jgi:GDPmannose 4,6-dehydratase
MRALITGVTGQGGSYLAEQLRNDGHEVWGLLHRQHNSRKAWIDELVPSIRWTRGDLLDEGSLIRALEECQPDIVYNLGAITFVGMSWGQPAVVTEVTALGALRMLEAIRHVNPDIRFVQASSSEMFGSNPPPQSETTQFHPRSPYGVAKLFAHFTTINYRESHGIHASTAIMFNYESPRRGSEFVSRKITKAAARISSGLGGELRLGNINAFRDWGYAPDYMNAVQMIGAHSVPDDFVVSSGNSRRVSELCDMAFRQQGLDYREHLVIDPKFYRKADVEFLRGDSTKIREALGWRPAVTLEEMVARMVKYELDALGTDGVTDIERSKP